MGRIKCPNCKGKKYTTWRDSSYYGVSPTYEEPCKMCAATGKVEIFIPARIYHGVKNISSHMSVETWEQFDDLKEYFKQRLNEATQDLQELYRLEAKYRNDNE